MGGGQEHSHALFGTRCLQPPIRLNWGWDLAQLASTLLMSGMRSDPSGGVATISPADATTELGREPPYGLPSECGPLAPRSTPPDPESDSLP